MLFKLKLLFISHVYTEKYLFKKQFRVLKKRILKYIKTYPHMISFPIEIEDLTYVYKCEDELKKCMNKINIDYQLEYNMNCNNYIQINRINTNK